VFGLLASCGSALSSTLGFQSRRAWHIVRWCAITAVYARHAISRRMTTLMSIHEPLRQCLKMLLHNW
jgi:hypothetical protein